MRESSQRHGRFGAICAVLVALSVMSVPESARCENEAVKAAAQRIVSGFQQGRMVDSLGDLPTVVDGLKAEPLSPRLWGLARLHGWCISAYSPSCERASAEALIASFAELEKDSEIQAKERYTLSAEYIDQAVRGAVAYNDLAGVRELLPVAEKLNVIEYRVRDFARTNASIAYGYLLLGDPTKANAFARRGWFHLLSNLTNSIDDFTEVLPEYLILFSATGQPRRAATALALARSAAYGLASTLPYHLLKLEMAEVLVQSRFGSPADVFAASQRASGTLAKLQLDSRVAAALSIPLLTSDLAACFDTSVPGCDVEATASRLTKVVESLVTANSDSRSLPLLHHAATTLAFYHRQTRTLPPVSVRDILASPRAPRPQGLRDPTEWITLLGKSFLDEIDRRSGAAAGFARAARLMLDEWRRTQAANPLEAAPLTLDESLVVRAAIDALSEAPLTPDNVSLLLELITAANRTWRNVESQVAYAASLLSSEEERESLRVFYNLELAIAAEERDAIANLSSLILQPPSSDKPTFDYKRLLTFGELDDRELKHTDVLEKVAASIVANPPDLLNQLQERLASDERFITHAHSLDRVVRLCVGRSSSHVGSSPQEPTRELLATKTLLAALTNPVAASDDATFPVAESAFLSQSVLGPGGDCIGNAEHIIAAPDQVYFRLPMHVLLDPTRAVPYPTAGLAGIPWLGSTRAISIVTDGRQFIAARGVASRPLPPKAFLGIGDPDLAASGAASLGPRVALRGSNGSSIPTVHDLEPLPQTRTELTRIAKIFGSTSKILLGRDASEVNLRRQAISEFRVISFATHGLTREELAGLAEPALVITPRNSAIPFNDGLLTATEISQFTVSADLVLLSACNSARFDSRGLTTEAVGLSTAFLLAGARTTVASMWSVESEATASLMEELARSFASDARVGAAQALRRAINKTLTARSLAKFAHPRYWAAFSVFGDGAPRSGAVSPRRSRLDESTGAALRPIWGEGFSVRALEDGTRLWIGFEDVGKRKVRGTLRIQPPGGRWLEITDDLPFTLAKGERVSSPVVFTWAAPQSNSLSLEFRSYDKSGHLRQRRPIDGLGDSYPAHAVALRGGRFLLGSFKVGVEYMGAAVSVRLLSSEGAVLRYRQYALAAAADISNPTVHLEPARDGGAWVVVHGTRLLEDTDGPPSRLGLDRSCGSRVRSLLYRLTPELELSETPIVLEDVEIGRISAAGDGSDVAAATIHDACNSLRDFSSGIAVLPSIGDARIFRASFRTGNHSGRVAIGLPNGETLLVSQVERDLGRWHKVEWLFTDDPRRPEDQTKNYTGSRQTGVAVTRFSRGGDVLGSWWHVPPGVLWPQDALLEADGSLLLVGTSNFNHFIAKCDPP